jgi:hypothetical protein
VINVCKFLADQLLLKYIVKHVTSQDLKNSTKLNFERIKLEIVGLEKSKNAEEKRRKE